MSEFTARTAMLLGERAIEALRSKRVAVFGLGGVGGSCAEALARSGVGRLHVVDGDRVEHSNLNRQLVATKLSLGVEKTVAMAKRIAEVSDCEVTAYTGFVLPEYIDASLPADVDYIADAIDTVSTKLALVRFANEHGIPIISCMGMGNRLDPTQITVRDIYATEGCPLARTMRRELKCMGIAALDVVFSTEPARVPMQRMRSDGGRDIPGSSAFVPPAAGLVMASEIVRRLCICD
ncbi:MAG: tRNA threonylcarbamoyladenosine dehydratase [Clostridia bacterium]|nr:tRNA threonylcarbamoyladenosine dehydratase [Clostridia bacterium]